MGDLGDVPAAAYGFDEQDAGGHPARQDIHRGNFIRESGALRGGYLEIVGDAALVAGYRQRKRVLGGGDCAGLGSAARLSSTSWKAVSTVWR